MIISGLCHKKMNEKKHDHDEHEGDGAAKDTSKGDGEAIDSGKSIRDDGGKGSTGLEEPWEGSRERN